MELKQAIKQCEAYCEDYPHSKMLEPITELIVAANELIKLKADIAKDIQLSYEYTGQRKEQTEGGCI